MDTVALMGLVLLVVVGVGALILLAPVVSPKVGAVMHPTTSEIHAPNRAVEEGLSADACDETTKPACAILAFAKANELQLTAAQQEALSDPSSVKDPLQPFTKAFATKDVQDLCVKRFGVNRCTNIAANIVDSGDRVEQDTYAAYARELIKRGSWNVEATPTAAGATDSLIMQYYKLNYYQVKRLAFERSDLYTQLAQFTLKPNDESVKKLRATSQTGAVAFFNTLDKSLGRQNYGTNDYLPGFGETPKAMTDEELAKLVPDPPKPVCIYDTTDPDLPKLNGPNCKEPDTPPVFDEKYKLLWKDAPVCKYDTTDPTLPKLNGPLCKQPATPPVFNEQYRSYWEDRRGIGQTGTILDIAKSWHSR